MANFEPNFDALQADESIKSASEFARRMLVEYLRQYAAFKGVSHSEIARLVGMRQPNVARIMNAKYSPTLDSFLKIASALDLHLDLSPKK